MLLPGAALHILADAPVDPAGAGNAKNAYLVEEVRTGHNFGEVVGDSAVLRRVLKQVEAVAPTGSTVLIRVDSGPALFFGIFALARRGFVGRSLRPLLGRQRIPYAHREVA